MSTVRSQPGLNRIAYLGISHGNVVALHSTWLNRFIRCHEGNVNGHGGPKDVDKLPDDWDSERFLAVQLDTSVYAFYGVYNDMFLCMGDDQSMYGATKHHLDSASSTNHRFLVNDEGNGKISLRSQRHNRFVRMNWNGVLDGHATKVNEWERFSVVLLMQSPGFEPNFPAESLKKYRDIERLRGNSDAKASRGALPQCGTAHFGEVSSPLAAKLVICARGCTPDGFAPNSCAMAEEAISPEGAMGMESLTVALQAVVALGILRRKTLALSLLLAGAVGTACYYAAVQDQSKEEHTFYTSGTPSNCCSISHGNVVALHSTWLNRFIRCYEGNVNGHGGPKDVDKLPDDWGSERFLAVQLDTSVYAFYGVYNDMFLCMRNDQSMYGATKHHMDSKSFTNHRFLVNDEGNGRISLRSQRHNRFVRMNWNGVLDGHATKVNEWERFSVVLLMQSPGFEPNFPEESLKKYLEFMKLLQQD